MKFFADSNSNFAIVPVRFCTAYCPVFQICCDPVGDRLQTLPLPFMLKYLSSKYICHDWWKIAGYHRLSYAYLSTKQWEVLKLYEIHSYKCLLILGMTSKVHNVFTTGLPVVIQRMLYKDIAQIWHTPNWVLTFSVLLCKDVGSYSTCLLCVFFNRHFVMKSVPDP